MINNRDRAYFLDRIHEYLDNPSIKSSYYKELLRSLLSDIHLSYIDDQGDYKEVKLHHGRQDRMVAKKFQENNLILPYSTIFQSSVEEDTGRRRTKDMLVFDTMWDDAEQRAKRVISIADVPVKVKYSLNVWSKYVSHIDQISSSLRSFFNPALTLRLKNNKAVVSYLKAEEDESKIEVNDKEDRLIRKNFTIEVNGYIPSPRFLMTNTGKIERVIQNIEITE